MFKFSKKYIVVQFGIIIFCSYYFSLTSEENDSVYLNEIAKRYEDAAKIRDELKKHENE